MKIGFVGLGKMGMNMVERLLRDDHEVVVYNRTYAKTEIAEKKGAIAAKSLDELIQVLPAPKIIWLMLPAGEVTEKYLLQLSKVINAEDILIDGGNAFYQDSMRRAKILAEKKINFIDAGVSGGIFGKKLGYCMMIGGKKNNFQQIEPILKTLAPEDGYAHVGKHGSGHFTKMVHNGIEYAMLQAYGEGFEILHAKQEFNLDLEKIADLWNHGGVIRSWLLELGKKAFSDDPKLDAVDGIVPDSGEGRWTAKEAIDLNVPAPTITASLLQRFRSRQKGSFTSKLIAALRNQFGGHAVIKRK